MFRRTSAMVEAGVLAAVAIVMALVGMYVPVIGAFVNFIWALPISICGMRNGFKWSLMCLVVASAIVAMVINPVQAVFLAAIFGLLGLVLGECLRRHLPPLKLMLYSSAGAVLALIINILLSFLVLGINPVDVMFTSFNESLVQLADFYRSHGMSEEDIKQAVNGYADMLSMMKIIMPGAFLMSAPILAFANYLVAKKILTKLGERFESFPPIYSLQVPGWLLVPYFASLLSVTWAYQYSRDSLLHHVSVNVQTVCGVLLVLQGIILLYWFMDKWKKPRWWAHLATCLIFVVPIFSQVLLYIGAFDIICDFRKLKQRRSGAGGNRGEDNV